MHYLSFELSEGDEGVTTLEAMASTSAEQHAAVMAESETLQAADLPERVRHARVAAPGFVLSLPEGDLSVKRAQRTLEREFILRALAQTDGNRTHAAKLLDLSHRALLYKIKEFGLG